MNLKKNFLIICSMLYLLVNTGPFEEYEKLKKDERISIRLDDFA